MPAIQQTHTQVCICQLGVHDTHSTSRGLCRAAQAAGPAGIAWALPIASRLRAVSGLRQKACDNSCNKPDSCRQSKSISRQTGACNCQSGYIQGTPETLLHARAGAYAHIRPSKSSPTCPEKAKRLRDTRSVTLAVESETGHDGPKSSGQQRGRQ